MIKSITMQCDWCEDQESFESELDLDVTEWLTVKEGDRELAFCCRACLESWL